MAATNVAMSTLSTTKPSHMPAACRSMADLLCMLMNSGTSTRQSISTV